MKRANLCTALYPHYTPPRLRAPISACCRSPLSFAIVSGSGIAFSRRGRFPQGLAQRAAARALRLDALQLGQGTAGLVQRALPNQVAGAVRQVLRLLPVQ